MQHVDRHQLIGTTARLAGRIWLPAFVLLCAFVSPAWSATRVQLIGPDLSPKVVNLQSLGDGRVSYFGSDRVYNTDPIDRVLRVTVIQDATDKPSPAPDGPVVAPSVLELSNGQRLVGTLVGPTADGQGVRWHHEALGDMDIPLDKVRLLSIEGAKLDDKITSSDRVWLANNDIIEGFVGGFDEKGLSIKPTGAKDAIALPRDRWKVLRLATGVEPAAERTQRIWLVDGSVVLASSISVSADVLTLEPLIGRAGASPTSQPSPITLPMNLVQRIDLSGGAGRLVDLSELGRKTIGGGIAFGIPMPVRFKERAVLMQSPVTIRFDLPAGAARFAAGAELDVDGVDERRALQWGDFELVARVDGKEIGRWRINAAQRSADLNLKLDGISLELEMVPGVNGPVMDRLRLRDPIVLIRQRK